MTDNSSPPSTGFSTPFLHRIATALIALIVCSVPLVFVPTEGRQFTLTKTVVFQCLALWLLVPLAARGVGRLRSSIEHTIDIPLFVWLGVGILSGVQAVSQPEWSHAAMYHALLVVFFYAVAGHAGRDKAHRIVAICLGVGTVVAVIGILEFFQVRLLDFQAARIISTLGHQSLLAQYLVVLIPVAFCMSLGEERRALRVFCLCVEPVIFCCCYMTYCRAALVGLLVSLCLLPVVGRLTGNRVLAVVRLRTLILVALAHALIIVAFAPGSYLVREVARRELGTPKRLVPAFDEMSEEGAQADTVRVRVLMWRSTARMIADRPQGVGWGNFHVVYPAYKSREELEIGAPVQRYAHNDFLQIAAETGIAGLLLFLLLIAACVRALLIAARRSSVRGERWLALGIVLSLAAMLTHCMFDMNFQQPAPVMMFWLFLGLARGAFADTRRRAEAAKVTSDLVRFVACPCAALLAAILAVAGTAYFVRQVHANWEFQKGIVFLSAETPDPAAARDHFRRAVEYNDSCPRHRYGYGRALYLTGSMDRAVVELEAAVDLAPYGVEHRLALAGMRSELGDARLGSGEWERALETYAAAIETLLEVESVAKTPQVERLFNSSLACAITGRAFALLNLGDLPGARVELARSLEYDPRYHCTWFALGDCCRAEGRHAEAREHYEQGRSLGADERLFEQRIKSVSEQGAGSEER
ncbi:MAG: O-antigen ligase family protein [Planctomycetota bacterium]|nr:O-antigen ligase family protein [Planctomycetota bacterium]